MSEQEEPFSTLNVTEGIRLNRLIWFLAQIEPEQLVTLKVDGGSATDLVGHLIVNLCTEHDIFSNKLYTGIQIEQHVMN